jgi:hypothetical protein
MRAPFNEFFLPKGKYKNSYVKKYGEKRVGGLFQKALHTLHHISCHVSSSFHLGVDIHGTDDCPCFMIPTKTWRVFTTSRFRNTRFPPRRDASEAERLCRASSTAISTIHHYVPTVGKVERGVKRFRKYRFISCQTRRIIVWSIAELLLI